MDETNVPLDGTGMGRQGWGERWGHEGSPRWNWAAALLV